jgi:hypothetical protein
MREEKRRGKNSTYIFKVGYISIVYNNLAASGDVHPHAIDADEHLPRQLKYCILWIYNPP